ncbi:MAG: GEVED domain-containing protein, partial [Flavobacteriales bacterium]|nr:GEVED domain-containing protein [Flavobacteriales bacterium]
MTYPITIQTGSAPQGVAVWIDWNADGDYIDPGELVLTGYTGSPSAIYSGNITIPSTANIGFTKMRVRSRANAVPSDPCANYPLGETEDYCLEILPFTCTWTGAVPAGPVWGHWTNPNNWDCGFVPTIFTNVIIPNIPIQPAIVLADGNAYNVTMHDGAKLLINNSNRRLNVANNWNGGSTTNAFVNHSTGPVRMLASDGYGVITGHTNFHTLEIASASGTIAIPSGNVTVRNAVRLMSGTLNTFGNLTLEALNAPAHSAAIVDNFSAGFTGTMVGNVKAQRRVPRFGNMYLGSPVNNGTIADMAAHIPVSYTHL